MQQLDGSLQVQNHQNILLSSNIEDLSDKIELYVKENLTLQTTVNEKVQENHQMEYENRKCVNEIERLEK